MIVKELALLVQGELEGDGQIEITGVSGPVKATVRDLTFAANESRLVTAENSATGCILTTKTVRKSSKTLIRVENPKLAFLVLYNVLSKIPSKGSFVHPSAVLGGDVVLGKNVWIGPHVTIGSHVTIGDDTIIDSHAVIQAGCSIGNACYLYPHVTLYENTVLKNHVVLHAGVVIGSDGFGYVQDKGKIYKFPQLGKVIIEDHVEIGANSTIDRGSMDDTLIGANSKIDNLCHIAHNVKTGQFMIMAAHSAIAGSTTLGDHVTISGQVAITDNISIGSYAVIGGKSTVIRDVKEKEVVWGTPARPIAQTKRQMAVLAWLTKNYDKLTAIVKEK